MQGGCHGSHMLVCKLLIQVSEMEVIIVATCLSLGCAVSPVFTPSCAKMTYEILMIAAQLL